MKLYLKKSKNEKGGFQVVKLVLLLYDHINLQVRPGVDGLMVFRLSLWLLFSPHCAKGDFFYLYFWLRVYSGLCVGVYICVLGISLGSRMKGELYRRWQRIAKEGKRIDVALGKTWWFIYRMCVLGGRNSKNAKMKFDCQVISGKCNATALK